MKAARTRALNKKHAGTAKHTSTSKHTPSATRKAATAHKQKAQRTAAQVKTAHLRAWTPDGAVALCTARAFAESLRIATGRAVADAAVLDVYWATAERADTGASILATADAILAEGLGGYFPLSVVPVDLDDPAAVILGLDMPEGRHTVAVGDGGTVWSWGAPYSLTYNAVVEEAWAVNW